MKLLSGLIGGMVMIWVATSNAWAHHGWAWTQDDQTEMTGTITEIFIGYPHPRLWIETASGERWTIDLGNPTQTRDAGFVEGVTQVGDTVLVRGHKSRTGGQQVMKAVRATIDGTQYTFYPSLLREDS